MIASPESAFMAASLESLFTEPVATDHQQKFLRVQLYPENTVLLAIDQIAAVVTIAVTDILPVPHMPGCVMGIYNWRGEMLWLVDLALQVGFTSLLKPEMNLTTVMAIVIQMNGQSLGLVVPEVHDIEQHDPQQIYSPSAELFSSALLPFVKGYLMSDRSTVLDSVAILKAPFLQIHRSH